MNITSNFTSYKTEIPVGRHYVEDLCRGYSDWFIDLHIKLAFINIIFYFVFPLLEKYQNKKLIDTTFENDYHLLIKIQDIKNAMIGLFMLINFFYFGYWLISGNLDTLRSIPVIRWLV